MEDQQNTAISVADHPVTNVGDLIGTIGFGVLIGLGGLPCIILNPTDPVLVVVGLIPILFATGWGYTTWRKWRLWRVLHPLEVRVTPGNLCFGEDVQVECFFKPTMDIEIEEITLGVRTTRITMERMPKGSYMPRPVKAHKQAVTPLRNGLIHAGDEVRVTSTLTPNPEVPASQEMQDRNGQTIIWAGYAEVKVKGLRPMEHSTPFYITHPE